MSENRPLLSICLPTHNRAGYFRECLDALLETAVDCEVIVSDNASTDETPELEARYAADPRVRWYRQPENIGVIANHNFLFRQARGRYMGFFGDDDLPLPGCFDQKVALLERFPEIDVVYSRCQIIDAEGNHLPTAHPVGLAPYSYIGGRDEFQLLLACCFMTWQSIVYRREVYEAVGGFDPEGWGLRASMDWYWLQLAMRGRQAAYINEPTVLYRVHEGGFSREAERQGHFLEDRFTVWGKWLLASDDPPVVGEGEWQLIADIAESDARSLPDTDEETVSRCRERLRALRTAYEDRMRARFTP